MNKSLIPALILFVILGSAIWIGFNSSSKAPLILTPPPAPNPVLSTSSPLDPTSFKPDDRSRLPSPTQATTPSATPGTPPAPAPGQPVKTLDELYRTLDAINAAADATTPESLKTLVTYASTENADVRSEALSALVRRGDASAAPALRAAAKRADSPQETIDLLQTADYLELPSADLTAIEAATTSRKAAAAGPNGPKHPGSVPSPYTAPATTP